MGRRMGRRDGEEGKIIYEPHVHNCGFDLSAVLVSRLLYSLHPLLKVSLT